MLNDTWKKSYDEIYSKVVLFLFKKITHPVDYPELFVERYKQVNKYLQSCVYYKEFFKEYIPYFHLVTTLPKELRNKLIKDINQGFYTFCLARDVANYKAYIYSHRISKQFKDNLQSLVGLHEIKILNIYNI